MWHCAQPREGCARCCQTSLATSPSPNVSKASAILIPRLEHRRVRREVRPRSWYRLEVGRIIQGSPKPLRCSHEEHYRYAALPDTVVSTFKEERTNTPRALEQTPPCTKARQALRHTNNHHQKEFSSLQLAQAEGCTRSDTGDSP